MNGQENKTNMQPEIKDQSNGQKETTNTTNIIEAAKTPTILTVIARIVTFQAVADSPMTSRPQVIHLTITENVHKKQPTKRTLKQNNRVVDISKSIVLVALIMSRSIGTMPRDVHILAKTLGISSASIWRLVTMSKTTVKLSKKLN